jgi:hypothetical protein
MKKLFLCFPAILLMAAGCNSSATIQPTAQITPTPQQQVLQNQVPPTAPPTTAIKPGDRDTLRISQAGQIAAGLDVYYSANNSYPTTLSQLLPKYLEPSLLDAPEPPDGTCTAAQNDFQYSYIDSSHYKLSFCLGSANGHYVSGLNYITASGN